LGFGFAGKFLGISGQNSRAAFDQQDAGLPRIDMAELVVQGVVRDFSESACEFDAGGSTAPTTTNCSGGSPLAVGSFILTFGLPLGQFECQQNAAADLQGIFNRLQTGRERLPLFMAKVGVGGARGDDQKVVIETCSLVMICLWSNLKSTTSSSNTSTLE
jgi:hypothetical protein